MVGHMATLLAPFEMSQARPCLRGSLPWSPHRTPCGDYFEGACLATCLENLSLFPPLSGHCSLTEHENPCPQQRRRLRCHRHSCFSCCLPSALSLPLQPPPLPGALRCLLPLPSQPLSPEYCWAVDIARVTRRNVMVRTSARVALPTHCDCYLYPGIGCHHRHHQ